MRNSWYKSIKRKIHTLSKVVPPALLFPGILLIGFFVLFTLFGFLTKGLIVVGLLIFFRKYLKGAAKERGIIQKKKAKVRAGSTKKKPQQKQPARDIL